MEALEALKTGSTLLGVLAPVVTLFYFSGAVVQRIKNLEGLIQRLLDQESKCRASREETEGRLNDRCTGMNERLSRIEGWRNGHGSNS